MIKNSDLNKGNKNTIYADNDDSIVYVFVGLAESFCKTEYFSLYSYPFTNYQFAFFTILPTITFNTRFSPKCNCKAHRAAISAAPCWLPNNCSALKYCCTKCLSKSPLTKAGWSSTKRPKGR